MSDVRNVRDEAPVLLAVAHGSRDPRHAAEVEALLARVRAERPGTRVEVAYLDHCGPDVPATLDALARTCRPGAQVVAVPLLLTSAYHAKTDVPAALAAYRPLHLTVHQGAPLGPSPLLRAALERRVREAGVAPGDPAYGVVLASAGSTDPEANAGIAEVAREWRRTGWCAVVPAFASARRPAVGEAIAELRAAGARQVAVAQYMLAPGFLPDRIERQAREAGADVVTETLADTPEAAALVWERYGEALGLRVSDHVGVRVGGHVRDHVAVRVGDHAGVRVGVRVGVRGQAEATPVRGQTYAPAQGGSPYFYSPRIAAAAAGCPQAASAQAHAAAARKLSA